MGQPNLFRETKFSGANRVREKIIFPVQLTTSRIGNHIPVDAQYVICDDYTYIIYTYIIHVTVISCRTILRPVLFIALRCSSVRCSGPTPFASRACNFFRFSEMPCTPRRSCGHSVTAPIATAMSREISGGRMVVTSLMNETALAPSTGVLVLNFGILSEPEL